MDNSYIIDNLLGQKESARLTFKAKAEIDAIAKSITALINTKGGDLVVGVNEEKEVLGVENAGLTADSIREYLIEHIKPTAPIFVQAIPYKKKEVILISVWEGAKKPYQYKGIIFSREGQKTQTAKADELPRLIKQRKEADFHWERQPVLGAELNDLDNAEIKETIKFYKEYKVNSKIEDAEDFLIQTGLAQNGNITNAAMVLFGKHPIRFIPQSRIRVTLYPGKTPGNQFLDDKMFEENIFMNINALFSYLEAVYGRTLTVRALVRTDKDNYPVLAIREGILNAIVHRDYNSVRGFLQISIYSDRTEISNYGALPNGITIADLKTEHSSILRNPDIAQTCFYRKYIEMLGTGTQRMIKDCRNNRFRPPVWKVGDNTTTVVFAGISHNKVAAGINEGMFEGLSKTVIVKVEGIIEGISGGITEDVKDKMKKILLLLHKEGGIRTVDIASRLDIPPKSIERYIKDLRVAGLIEYQGAKRTGGYYLDKATENKIKNKQG